MKERGKNPVPHTASWNIRSTPPPRFAHKLSAPVSRRKDWDYGTLGRSSRLLIEENQRAAWIVRM